jgi:hypothetical protein
MAYEGIIEHQTGLVNGSARDTMAQITREQYDNFLKVYYPQQQQLLQTASDGSLMTSQLGLVNANFDSANTAAQTSNNNMNARYGVASTGPTNSDAAQLALSKATAKNGIREYEQDRSLSILSGSNLSPMTAQQGVN